MPYLDTFVHSTDLFNPLATPTALLLPSLHPPNGRPRDSSPALAVAFNRIAKYYDAAEAHHAGQRRLMAVASDEGGLRVVDVDEPVGLHREQKGYWWRGHANTVYDIKWSADGTKLVSLVAEPGGLLSLRVRCGGVTDALIADCIWRFHIADSRAGRRRADLLGCTERPHELRQVCYLLRPVSEHDRPFCSRTVIHHRFRRTRWQHSDL